MSQISQNLVHGDSPVGKFSPSVAPRNYLKRERLFLTLIDGEAFGELGVKTKKEPIFGFTLTI